MVMKAGRFFLYSLIFAMAASVMARTNTLRKGELRQEADLPLLERTACGDTTAFADCIIVSGYSKTVSDAYESFYVTNKTPFRLSRLILKFVYTYAGSEEILHEQVYEADCDIPSGETRQLSVHTFDRQHQLYYEGSRRPRRPATPFALSYEVVAYDVRVVVSR